MDEPDNLVFAVPKKGRLFEKCDALLKGSGLDYTRPARVDIADCWCAVLLVLVTVCSWCCCWWC